MAESTVLVTGSAGRIGRAVVRELLARGHAVRGFDRVPTPGLADALVGDLTDGAAVRRAAQGVQRARSPRGHAGRRRLPDAAAAQQHRRRLSRHGGGARGRRPPRGPGQQRAGRLVSALHRAAAHRHRRAADAARLVRRHQGVSGGGRPGLRRGARPQRRRGPPRLVPAQRASTSKRLRAVDWAKDVYLSPGDAGRFFACAVEAPADIRFAVVYACSRPLRQEYYDARPARDLLGYEPRDQWPQGIEEITGEK